MALLNLKNLICSITRGRSMAFLFLVLLMPQAFASTTLVNLIKPHFKNCPIEEKNIFLSDEQVKEIKQLSETDLETALITSFKISCAKKHLTAYLDTNLVRTHEQTLLISVDTKSQIDSIITLNFPEPPQYKSPYKWLDLFKGKVLNDNLKLKRDIDIVSGATLTSRSTLVASRRVLAIHKLVNKK